jgi:FkbM family methyltransferase
MFHFTSQFGEDIYVYNNFINVFNNDGIFVELGAMDGIIYSNSNFFEKSLGFSGVLIEPTEQYNNLIINRPNCKNVNLAVNYNNNKSLFFGKDAVGGLIETMSENFKNTYHNNSESYFVNCCPFFEILNNNNISYIDLLIIDVEGAELVVLETMDFNIPVFVIIIELDSSNLDKDQKCRDILLKNGFVFDIRVNINEFWINKEYFRKNILFDKTKPKINFLNFRQFGYFSYIDFNHHHIHELHNSLLENHSIV